MPPKNALNFLRVARLERTRFLQRTSYFPMYKNSSDLLLKLLVKNMLKKGSLCVTLSSSCCTVVSVKKISRFPNTFVEDKFQMLLPELLLSASKGVLQKDFYFSCPFQQIFQWPVFLFS